AACLCEPCLSRLSLTYAALHLPTLGWDRNSDRGSAARMGTAQSITRVRNAAGRCAPNFPSNGFALAAFPRLFPGWQLCGAECIGKTLRRRAWFEGFLLALMGHPTRKPDDFESRTDASIGVGKTLDINLRHTCERRALE